MKMRRVLAMSLSIILSLGLLAGCNSEEAPEETSTTAPEEVVEEDGALADIYANVMTAYEGIEPLEERVTIRYGDGVGYQLSVPIYIAWQSGGLEAAGVDLEWYPSATGPLRIEAIAADEIDLFGSGIGGIAIGCAQGTAKMLTYINDDSVVQKFYVKGDDPLASAAENDAGFKGSADDWRGREVYMQAGSTLQYLMGHALNGIGLSLQDITPVYMDAPNVNAAMFAGQGETWGVWNFQCYDQDLTEQGFVPVIEGYDAGIRLVTAYGTSDAAWSDPQKRAGIEKILEIHYATLEWMMASEENMEMAAQVLTDWGEQEGTAVPYEENLAYLQETHYYTLDENYDFFTKTVENEYGTMYEALDMLMGIMDFYVEQGNYQESDREYMIEHQDALFTSEGLDYVTSARQ